MATNQKKSKQDEEHRPFWQRIVDLIFGYDYFISYAWNDGRIYAENLRKALTSHRLKCFLDSKEFAKGSNWHFEAKRALKKQLVWCWSVLQELLNQGVTRLPLPTPKGLEDACQGTL